MAGSVVVLDEAASFSASVVACQLFPEKKVSPHTELLKKVRSLLLSVSRDHRLAGWLAARSADDFIDPRRKHRRCFERVG